VTLSDQKGGSTTLLLSKDERFFRRLIVRARKEGRKSKMAAFLFFQKKLKLSACGFYEFNRFATFLVNFMQERNISTRTTRTSKVL
jgi:hypothetical protein